MNFSWNFYCAWCLEGQVARSPSSYRKDLAYPVRSLLAIAPASNILTPCYRGAMTPILAFGSSKLTPKALGFILSVIFVDIIR